MPIWKNHRSIVLLLVFLTFTVLMQPSVARTASEIERVEEFVAGFLKASEIRNNESRATTKSTGSQCESTTDRLIVQLPEITKVMQQEMTTAGMRAHEFIITTQQGRQSAHLTESCAQCFSNGVSCGMKHCWKPCLLSHCSKECQECYLGGCMEQLLTCTGTKELSDPCNG